MKLRPYQQDAVDAALRYIGRSVMPSVLELATGAGKSLVVAEIAKTIFEKTGKRVLCLAPSKELTEQNHAKYLLTGNKASIFSASAGSKCMRHPVVYGTPGTVKNSLSRFGDQFALVIIDEAHGITETIRMILGAMRERNPLLRVIGMTATPYRTMSGYIYQYDVDGGFIPEETAREPYFHQLLYRIQTQQLIDMGFLTPIHCDPDHAEGYDTSTLVLNRRGQFDAAEVERVFVGRGRKTSGIVEDFVSRARYRLGVMIFAATVDHAKEIMESLPPENSRMVGGDVNMGKAEREKVTEDYKAMRFKYLVSVGTLTTGFDAPHTDMIVVMRATESPGLFQQIIGRGSRLFDGKSDTLLCDYAGNIERHKLDDDLYRPEIKARGAKGGEGGLEAQCPQCGYVNQFTGRPNPDQFAIDAEGYFIDLAGMRIETDHGPMPAHFGRRCCGQVKSLTERGVYERCTARWTFKECPECKEENDIAARYCSSCRAEIVDPNEKLQEEFTRRKKDPYQVSTDKVLAWECKRAAGNNNRPMLAAKITTEYRTVTHWFDPNAKGGVALEEWQRLNKAIFKGHVAPDLDTFERYLTKADPLETITYARKPDSKWSRMYAFNQPEDAL